MVSASGGAAERDGGGDGRDHHQGIHGVPEPVRGPVREGDLTLGLGLLVEALRPEAAKHEARIAARRQRVSDEHDRLAEATYAAEAAASNSSPIDPAWLGAALSEVMPEDVVYAEGSYDAPAIGGSAYTVG